MECAVTVAGLVATGKALYIYIPLHKGKYVKMPSHGMASKPGCRGKTTLAILPLSADVKTSPADM
jgi:hypothetical protein